MINRNVIIPKINIDDKIVGKPDSGCPQGVTFYTLWANKKCNSTMSANDNDGTFKELKPRNIQKCSSACFADLHTMFSQKKSNTLFYHVNQIHCAVTSKMSTWLEILAKEKVIPEYCGKNTFKSGTIILDISEMPIPTIYVRLCMLRYLREYPKVIISSLYLMELGLDFFSAVVFCAGKLIWGSGHNFVESTNKYGNPGLSCNEALIDVRLIWAIRELIVNRSAHSKYYLSNRWVGFQTIKTIEQITKKLPLLKVTLAELLRPDLAETLRNSNEKYVSKFFNEYKRFREQQKKDTKDNDHKIK